MTTHAATHTNTQLHFLPEGKALDDYPIDHLISSGIAIEVGPLDREEAITVRGHGKFETEITDSEVGMLYTDWSRQPA